MAPARKSKASTQKQPSKPKRRASFEKRYVCRTAWVEERNDVAIRTWATLDEAKDALTCWDSCGILELTITTDVAVKGIL